MLLVIAARPDTPGTPRQEKVVHDAAAARAAAQAGFRPILRANEVRGDHDAPVAEISGSLWENDGAVLREPSYALQVSALDGKTGSQKESGVDQIVIKVDGRTAFHKRNPCNRAGCGLQARWPFDSARWGDGDHLISVLVNDQSGNSVRQDVNVTVALRRQLLPQTLTSTSLPARRFSGSGAGDQAGRAVQAIGDVNGDQADDFAIGAPHASQNGRADSGSVYVVYGGSNSRSLGLDDPGRAGFRIDGANPGDLTGLSVANAGDVNKDRFNDLLVGAPGVGELESRPVMGHAWVVFGGPTHHDIDLRHLGGQGFEIKGPVEQALLAADSPGSTDLRPATFGANLSGPEIGLSGTSSDVNHDGFDDVVVGGATDSNGGRPLSGSTYVIYGKRDSRPVDVSAPTDTWGFRIDGTPGSLSGQAAVSPGDVDGDGFADVLVSAPGLDKPGRLAAGTAFLVYGRKLNENIDLGDLGSAGYPIYGAGGDQLGSSAAAVGDINSDDLDDIAVGGHGGFVLYGDSASHPRPVDLSAPWEGYAIDPPPADGYSTGVIAGAGDLNDDDIPDILLGFPASSPAAPHGGSLFAVFGRDATEPRISLASLPGQWGTQIVGSGADERLGISTAGVDFDRAAQPGLLVGAPGEGEGGPPGSGSALFVASGALAGSLAGPVSTRGVKKAFVRRRGCYPFTSPAYGYVRQSDNPFCRATAAGKVERALGRSVGYGRAAKTLRDPIRPGKHPVVDSFGRPFAYLEQKGLKQFKIYDEHGKFAGKTKRTATLQMQGRACMATTRLIDGYFVLTLSSNKGKNRGPGPGGFAVDVGLRGFVSRRLLRPGTFHHTNPGDSRSNDAVIDKYDSGCGKPTLYRNQAGAPDSIGKPIFNPQSDRYQGAKRECAPTSPFLDCGGTYHDYTRPQFDSGVVPLTSATTGVRNGGIVRAITTSDRPFRVLDSIPYADPNVPCGRRPVARWVFGDANPFATRRQHHIYGWVPRRVTGEPPRRC